MFPFNIQVKTPLSNFTLTVKDNIVTLDAKDTLLNQIVEEIGSRGIEVKSAFFQWK